MGILLIIFIIFDIIILRIIDGGQAMNKTYYLFLDESKPNVDINHLCLAGVIIEKDDYEKNIIPAVNSLKNKIFDNTEVILHETEIRNADEVPYRVLRSPAKRNDFWAEMRNIFSSNHIKTIGAAIDCTEFKRIYQGNYANDPYFIGLQIILENFTHFLEHNNGQGIIYIESRNPTDDTRLRDHYHKIVSSGTLFLNKYAFQRKLSTINFLIKGDNNTGLQLADFVPNPFNRDCNGKKQKEPSLFDLIQSNLYDGHINLNDRFGFKKIL